MDSKLVERQALLDVWRKAKAALEYSWDDIDDDAKATIEELSNSVERVEHVRELIAFAEQELEPKKGKP